MGLLDSLDDSKDLSEESIYSVSPDDIIAPKIFHVYSKFKGLHIQKVIQDSDKNPIYLAEFHYSRSSSLKERYVQIWAGEDTSGPLIAKLGSNNWMTKFKFVDSEGQTHVIRSDSFAHYRYYWTIPGTTERKLVWKNTRHTDIEDAQKKSRIRRGLKLVDEQDRIIAMFVYTKIARKKDGRFIMNMEHVNSLEFERGVILTGLAILEVIAIANNSSASA